MYDQLHQMDRNYSHSKVRQFILAIAAIQDSLKLCCPTLTKGSNWQITQIWESDVFRLDLAYSTCIPSLEHWTHPAERYLSQDIALMSMYITDTFCSFTRNVIYNDDQTRRIHVLSQSYLVSKY